MTTVLPSATSSAASAASAALPSDQEMSQRAERCDDGREHALVTSRTPGHPTFGELVVFHKGERLTISIMGIERDGRVRLVTRGRRSFAVWRRELVDNWNPPTAQS